MSHALLSPSASHRWIQCPPSARLTEFAEDKSSTYAEEGTLAHSIAENKFNNYLGYTDKSVKCEDNLMDEYTNDYVAFIAEQMSVLNNPSAFVEQRVDCSKYIPECFGTCDALIISDGILHICDLKYGTGIKIDAVENDQLRIYALGALEMFSCLYDISTVRMSIFQPRLSHCDTWELSVDELLKWAEEVLVPAAKQAWNGEGEFKAGEHCRFCKVRATCRKLAEYNLSLARYDFEPPATLDNTEIAAVLAKADELVSWVTDVKEVAPMFSAACKSQTKRDKLKAKMRKKCTTAEGDKSLEFSYAFIDNMEFLHPQTITRQFYSDYITPLGDNISVEGTTVHIIYAKQMGEKYYRRYIKHFKNPDIHEFDMKHEVWLYNDKWHQPVLDCVRQCMEG